MKKLFRRAYLHVGLGKTGSSAIQQAMLASADLLEADYGIYYPRGLDDPRPFAGNHTLLLATLFKSQPELIRANVVAKIDTPERVSAFNRRLQSELEARLAKTVAPTLLMSAEGVGDFEPEAVDRLLSWLTSVADDVRIVACLRHPMNALASTIQQKLKTDGTLPALYENPPVTSFRTILGQLQALVGTEAVDAYDFADAKEHEGGIVGAFLARLGLPPAALPKAEETVNPSMSQEGAELLSALNKQRPSVVNGRATANRAQGDISIFMQIPGRQFRVPASVYTALDVRIAPDLAWLEEQFQIVLRLLDCSSALDESEPYSDESLEHIAVTLAELHGRGHC